MVSVTDAQRSASSLQGLINSLATASDKEAVRGQIQRSALGLQSQLLSLTSAAANAAWDQAAALVDAEIIWAAAPNINRTQVINAAASIQPINGLLNQVQGWSHRTGASEWSATPEVAAEVLIDFLSSYRSITGT